LGKVPVKGEGQAKSEALHHGKADGIRKGKIFVCVLKENLFCAFLISGADSDNHNWWWQAENGQFGRKKMNTFATV
jgi:hypothetical protein